MSKVTSNGEIWTWRNRRTGHRFEEPLNAYWEVSHDPMSDDHTPDEMDAVELLREWATKVQKDYENNLVPIHWFAGSERMPFQFLRDPKIEAENFLTHFTWPANKRTGDRLNWLVLPVVDKLWNENRADKGGFIQEATGWKPSILQPFVYLPSILSALE